MIWKALFNLYLIESSNIFWSRLVLSYKRCLQKIKLRTYFHKITKKRFPSMFSGRLYWSRNDCEYHLRLTKSRCVDVISRDETHEQLSDRCLRTFCQDSRSFNVSIQSFNFLCSGIPHCHQTCIFARYHRLFSSTLLKEFPSLILRSLLLLLSFSILWSPKGAGP